MKKIFILCFFVNVVVCQKIVVALTPETIQLKEVLTLSVKNHPNVIAAEKKIQAYAHHVDYERHTFYPQISLMGVASTGYAGSYGSLGVEGLMISPYRVGPGAGIYVYQDIWDFGRTTGNVAVGINENKMAEEDGRITRLEVAGEGIREYYQCSRDYNLTNLFRTLVTEAKSVEREVDKFVKTGQRSIVDIYLSSSQTEEIITIQADYDTKSMVDRDALATLIGKQKSDFLCPEVNTDLLKKEINSLSLPTAVSPYLTRAQAQIYYENSHVDRARAEYWPKIVAVGSFGMNSSSIVYEKTPYALGIGLILPIFEGFKTNSEVDTYLSRSMEAQKNYEGLSLNLDIRDLEYDKEILSSHVRATHLIHEKEIADKGYQLAKKRYISEQGTLIDLREALNNIIRIYQELKRAEAEELEKMAQKNLIDGKFKKYIES